MHRTTKWLAPGALGGALMLAGTIMLTHPIVGHHDPNDALRVLIRATGLLSALMFGVALSMKDELRSRDAFRALLASHLVHAVALAAGGLLWSPERLGEVARQSHVVFALFPDWTPIVLGGAGFVALFVLALARRPLPFRVRIGAEVWLLCLFVSFYVDAFLSRWAEHPVAALFYAALAVGLTLIGARRWRPSRSALPAEAPAH